MHPGWDNLQAHIKNECIVSQYVDYPASATKDQIDEINKQILQDQSSAIASNQLIIVAKPAKNGESSRITVYGP